VDAAPQEEKMRRGKEKVYHEPSLSLVYREPYDARAMRRVRGIGGVFFKSENPEALRVWYAKHLGVVSDGDHGTMFRWDQPDNPSKETFTAWCIFLRRESISGRAMRA
jgi:hypothetical protein